MNQEQIKEYSLRLLRKCVQERDITLEEFNNQRNQDIALEETEENVRDCEEIGSSDRFYHRQSILFALGKPSIHSKETNKYNKRFRNSS
ncbi:MAG: hypothetical protein P8J32_04490 [bacterium]|nr:hypothetical protein [bacterium]